MKRQAPVGTEEVLRPIAGYYSPVWKQILYAATVLCTCGVCWMFATLWPGVMILLRLRPCSVQSASFVKVQLHSGQVVLLRVFAAAYGRAAPAAGLQQGAASAVQLAQLYGYWYSHNVATGMFEKIPRMPIDLPQQLAKALRALSAIDEGADWTHFNAPGSWPRQQRIVMHGTNSTHISRPVLVTLMLKELVNPDVLVPIMLMSLWMYGFRYFYYPSVLMAIMLIGTAISVGLTYRQRQMLFKLFARASLVPYVRKGYVRATTSQRLLPGDVMVVQQGVAVCDMVLLRGNCLVEASKLSGEALQMRKNPYVPESVTNVKYDPDVHSSSTILAGSVIHQVWNDKDEQDECLAMVVRTGLNTTVGNMMRPLLHSHWTRKHLRNFMGFYRQDVAQFFLWSGLVQLIMFLVLVPSFVQSHASARSVLLQLLLALIGAAVPGLAAVLVLVRIVTLLRLRRQGVIVSDTHRMFTAGHLDVVLFDKTGTLTNEQGKLHGIIACEHGQLAGLKTEAVAWGSDIKRMLALCHDLVPLSKGQIVGPLYEQRAFAAVEASFMGRNTICLPLRTSRKDSARLVQLEVLRRFEYDPRMMMSGVIAKSKSSTHCERAQVLIKGASYEVSQLADSESLPKDWAQAMMYWMSLGYRVLGLVAGRIIAESKQDLTNINLQNIKQHTYGMRMLGFAVISNPLRSDSTAAITELQDRGRLHTIMVTGDHHLTAASVAQVTGMLNFKRPHVLIAQPETLNLPSVSSPWSPTAMRPEDTLGQRRTRSAAPVDLRALAELQSQLQQGSSRSRSLSHIELTSFKDVSGASFSSKPLVPKPALQHPSPPQAAHITSSQMRASHVGAQQQQPARIDESSQSLLHARSSEPFALSQLSAQTNADNLAHLQQPASAEPDQSQDELSFIMTEEGKLVPLSRREAFAMIAAGHQCIITGSAFDHLVHQADPFLLETVLHSVAVCARMKAHQKAQLVNLLSDQGLTVSSTRKFKGLGHVVGYCGDGINDVPALQAADAGLSMGGAEAGISVVAAPVASLSGSVTAICTLVREARCGLAVAYCLFKYNVLFGFIVSLMGIIVNVANSTGLRASTIAASTQITEQQYNVANYVGLLVSLGFVLTHASPHLHPARLPQRLVSAGVTGPVVLFMGFFALEQGIAVIMLHRQSWYHPQESKVPLLATVLLIGLAQLLAPAVSFSVDMQPHCLGLRHNPITPLIIFVACTVGIVRVLYPAGFGGDLLRQGHLPFTFRVELLIYMGAWGVVLIIGMKALRRCISSVQARRIRKISAEFYVPTSTDGLGISRPLGRKSFDGRDAVLRSTGSTDAGDWLRRTASATVDLSTVLPSGHSNKKIVQGQLAA